jgi:hypothetical protein
VPGLRWLRRLAHKPFLADAPEIGVKSLRDCSDEEVEAIARYYSQEHASLWDYDECLSLFMEPANTSDTCSRVAASSGSSHLSGLDISTVPRAAACSPAGCFSTFPLTAHFYVK